MYRKTHAYLGDNVYAQFNGKDFTLTEYREGNERTIVMRPDVMDSFFQFIATAMHVKVDFKPHTAKEGTL